ncbi:YHYH domain-containing protein [Faecalicoccus pleomorphus]|uniref:YHYH domain-containing protein n=1 Tax=Faecalicoccus pleomorphus TaxID=1323 RepID=UPI00232EF412|nr:YHYH domain-containing protein [Faecalicoccus pleomorphus]MDB7986178.1 YHYH domain-containing protein [Faecalicoccus pleomorphus]MDB7990374.1 YHYH domain-containing protein [Faecalicoccus pleomorphus]
MRWFKRIYSIIFILFLVCSLTIDSRQIIEAHPGRTDSSGCHTCRTNCEKWGLSYGQYHCHGGTSSSSGNSGNSSSANNNYYSQQQAQQEAIRQQQIKEEQERIQREQAEMEKNSGIVEGYDYKIAHPNEDMEDLTGKSDSYVQGYKEGFDKAKTELEDKTISLADKNASIDSKTLNAPSEAIPEGVIQALYTSTYQEKFKEYEEDFFYEVKSNAQYSAMIDVYDKYGKGDYSKEIEDKGRELYKKSYDTYYGYYQEEVEDSIEDAYDFGQNAGRRLARHDYSEYERFKDYKVYEDIIQSYKKGYGKGKRDRLIQLLLLGLLIVLGILGWYYFHKKRRKYKECQAKEHMIVNQENEESSHNNQHVEIDKVTDEIKDRNDIQSFKENKDQSKCEKHVDDIIQPNIYANLSPNIKKHKIFLNQEVSHIKYGKGIIVEISGKYFQVKFKTKTSKFIYPDAFEKGYLTTKNES